MVLRILQLLSRAVSSFLYALFVLVSPRRGAERVEPLTASQRSQSQAVMEELQMVRAQLETKMEEKKKIENTVTALQEKVKQLQDMLKMDKEDPLIKSEPSNVTPAQLSATPLPPPPPPPPPVLFTSPIDPLDALRNRKKSGNTTTDLKKPAVSVDVKARAVDEMMERIKKGVVLKPTQKPPQDQINEKRSAVLEVQGLLDTIKKPGPQKMPSRKMIGQNVEEAECPAPKAQVTSSSNWLAESGNVPVLRRLKQNH